jgi:hypothetical protein
MTLSAPVRYSSAVEETQSNEAEAIRGLNEAFEGIQTRTSRDGGRAMLGARSRPAT